MGYEPQDPSFLESESDPYALGPSYNIFLFQLKGIYQGLHLGGSHRVFT